MSKGVKGNPALDYAAMTFLEVAKHGRGYENLNIQILGRLSGEAKSITRAMYTVVSKSAKFRANMIDRFGSWENFKELDEAARFWWAQAFTTDNK